MSKSIKTVLLNALPAGGKTETRRFFSYLGAKVCSEEFHLGQIVSLDDYPYVAFMRRIDDVLASLGFSRFFFELPDRGFVTDRDWGTLIHLVNEDYKDLFDRPTKPQICSAARWLFERIDRARAKVGIGRFLEGLPAAIWWAIADALEVECFDFMEEKWKNIPPSMEGKTVVIEFSRGGGHGMKFPLSGGNGYAYSYAQLSPEILSGAAVIYIHVTPEISRAKNLARGQENATDKPSAVQLMSSLNHCVPDYVMWNAYGCDDIEFLLRTSDITGTIKVMADSDTFHLPIAFVDNVKKDLTSFTHKKEEKWEEAEKQELKAELSSAFINLIAQYERLHR